MKRIFTTLLLVTLTVPVAFAGSGREGGGGDFQGLSLYQQLKRLGKKILPLAPDFCRADEIKKISLILESEALLVLVVDGSLPAKAGDKLVQNSSMYSSFENDSPVIRVNRSALNEAKSKIDIQNLLLHEVLVLAQLEKTGDYHLTVKFINQLKQNTDPALMLSSFQGEVLAVEGFGTVIIRNPYVEVSNPKGGKMRLPIEFNGNYHPTNELCQEFGYGEGLGITSKYLTDSKYPHNPMNLMISFAFNRNNDFIFTPSLYKEGLYVGSIKCSMN